MVLRALRPPMIFGASLPGMIFPAQRPAEGSNSYHYGSHATRKNSPKPLSPKRVSIPLWFSRNPSLSTVSRALDNRFHTTMVLTQRSVKGRDGECLYRFHTTMVLTQLSHMDFAILAGDEFPYHYGSFTFGGQSHFVRPVFASQRPVPTSSGLRTFHR